jgi:hypothetical protein
MYLETSPTSFENVYIPKALHYLLIMHFAMQISFLILVGNCLTWLGCGGKVQK